MKKLIALAITTIAITACGDNTTTTGIPDEIIVNDTLWEEPIFVEDTTEWDTVWQIQGEEPMCITFGDELICEDDE